MAISQAGRSLLRRDAIVLAVFVFDLWAIDVAFGKQQCRRTGGTPVVSDAVVVCLRPGGVPHAFVPFTPTTKRGGR